MSLLDTFFVLFKADTKDLVKGADESAKKIKETGEEAIKASKTTQSAFSQMAGAARGLAAAYGLVAMAKKAVAIAAREANAVEEMRKTQVAIGVAIDDMDAFTRAVEANGGSIQGATASLVGLYRSAGLAAQRSTGMQAQAFKALGVSIKGADGSIKDSIELIHDISEAIEGMDDASAMAMLSRVGVSDRRTLELIMKGRRELEDQERIMRRAGVTTERQAEIAKAYSDATTDLNTALTSMRRVIMEMVTPALSWVTRQITRLTEFFTEHKAIAISAVVGISGALTALMIPALLATIKAMAPLLMVGGAIAAISAVIGLVVDDIIAWKSGNDSLIGELMEKYPVVKTLVEAIEAAFRHLVAFAPYVWDEIVSLGTKIGEGFAFAVEQLSLLFSWIAEKGGKIVDFVKGVGEGIGNFFGFGGGDVNIEEKQIIENAQKGVNILAAAASSPAGSVTSNVITNSTRQGGNSSVTVGELKIETKATDAKGVARDMRSELQDQLLNLNYATASGVTR